jgi:hypothetical protein
MAGIWRPGQGVPVLDPGPWEAPGSVTPGPAGWFTIAVDAKSTGFRLDRQALSVADLAAAIWHCPRWRGRPVLLLTKPSAAATGAWPVLRQLAVDLGAPVYAADAGVRLTFGRAHTAGVFWCWRPGPRGESHPVGRLLPPLGPIRGYPNPGRLLDAVTEPTPVTSQALPAMGTGALSFAVAALDLGTQPAIVPRLNLSTHQVALPGSGAPTTELEVQRPHDAEPLGSPPGVTHQCVGPSTASPAPWFAVRAHTEEPDRERMREALGWKFQAYSRTAARALSLRPGLRNAVGGHDVVAGLVAVLALLDGAGERVNSALRATGQPADDVVLLARCAAAGLLQLPAIGGAVFATAPAGLDVTAAYRPGELLVEPAFTTVSLKGAPRGNAPRYAIWSATARRLDLLCAPHDPEEHRERAMFAAGTRFAVLDVGDADDPPYVLLREVVFDRRDSGMDQRLTGKLRAALVAQAPTAGAALPWPLGIDSGNSRFALTLDSAGAHGKQFKNEGVNP